MDIIEHGEMTGSVWPKSDWSMLQEFLLILFDNFYNFYLKKKTVTSRAQMYLEMYGQNYAAYG